MEKRKEKKEKNVVFSGHYVIASSRPPERRPLERRTLVPTEKELILVLHVSTLPLQPLHIALATFAHWPGNPNP